MSRKFTLFSLTAFVVMAMMTISLQNTPVRAQDGATATATPTDDFPVWLEISGTIVSITQQSNSVWIVVLEDGTELLINPATNLGGIVLTVGQAIVVQVSMDEEEDGRFVAKIITSSGQATPVPTGQATVTPTGDATVVPTVVPTVRPTGDATEVGGCQRDDHPVATRLADAFEVPYDEIMGWHCQGFGFGEIARAYLLAQHAKDGKTAAEYLALKKSGQGWGQIMKDAGVSHKDLAPGSVIRGKDKKNNSNDAKDKGNNKDKDKNKNKNKNNGNGNGGNKGGGKK
jgi:hypothetical protein